MHSRRIFLFSSMRTRQKNHIMKTRNGMNRYFVITPWRHFSLVLWKPYWQIKTIIFRGIAFGLLWPNILLVFHLVIGIFATLLFWPFSMMFKIRKAKYLCHKLIAYLHYNKWKLHQLTCFKWSLALTYHLREEKNVP